MAVRRDADCSAVKLPVRKRPAQSRETPNLGANKSLGVAWSEGVDSARDIAEGFSMSTGIGVSFVTGSKFTGAEPVIESPQQSGLLASINSGNSDWHPPLMPEPGITGFTLGFGPSLAPANLSSLACQCTVLNEGTLSDQYTPLPVKAYNWIYDAVEN